MRSRLTNPPPFNIVISSEPGAVAVEVVGEVDVANAELLCDAVEAADDASLVLVDLRRSTFVDLPTLSLLLRCSQRRAASGKDLLVVDPPPSGEKILAATGLGQQLRWRRRCSVGSA